VSEATLIKCVQPFDTVTFSSWWISPFHSRNRLSLFYISIFQCIFRKKSICSCAKCNTYTLMHRSLLDFTWAALSLSCLIAFIQNITSAIQHSPTLKNKLFCWAYINFGVLKVYESCNISFISYRSTYSILYRHLHIILSIVGQESYYCWVYRELSLIKIKMAILCVDSSLR